MTRDNGDTFTQEELVDAFAGEMQLLSEARLRALEAGHEGWELSVKRFDDEQQGVHNVAMRLGIGCQVYGRLLERNRLLDEMKREEERC